MATLAPFRALRPSPSAAARVAAVPYDVCSTDEARALAAGNPLSFLHVSRPEIDLPPGADPHDDAAYVKAAENFERLAAAAPLVREDAPSVYLYRLRRGTHVQTGVAGAFAVEEYERGLIKKHERTRADKEDDRTRHILQVRAQTGPVLLTYRRLEAIDAAVAGAAAATRPMFEFTAADGVDHAVWRTEPGDARALIGAFDDVPALYIADGHHRAASAARVRQQLRRDAGAGDWDLLLAVAFPDTEMQVLPYNRVVKDLGAHTPAALLALLERQFAVRGEGTGTPARPGEVSMFLEGRWHTIVLDDAAPHPTPAERLDVSRLQQLILTPLLGIGDPRQDTRIDFVGGARGTPALEQLVESGAAAVAFAMHPVGIDDLMAIADAGGIMPPKSTWFEPKLRDGLLSHVI